MHVGHCQRAGVAGGERRASGEHLVADHTEGVDVARRRGLRGHGLFGRDVPGGAHDLSDLRQRNGISGTRDAEVRDLDRSVIEQEDVAGFDVAVHHTGHMCGVQCFGCLRQHGESGVEWQCSLFCQDLGQRFAGDEFHHDIGEMVLVVTVLSVVEDAGDARMRQRCRVSGLSAEALQKDAGVDEVVAKDLDGNLAAQHRVGRRPHLAHATDRNARRQGIPLTHHPRHRRAAPRGLVLGALGLIVLGRCDGRHVEASTRFRPG